MEVFAFVDTNIVLQYKPFDEVDWAAQFGVPEVTLVFTPGVVADLDYFKWSGTKRQKARARAGLKKIHTLALNPAPVPVRARVHAMALDAEPLDALFVQHRLRSQDTDDRLLASLLGFREEHPGDRVLILSGDEGLAIKARSRKLEIVAPDESLELPDEPDEVERELEKTKRELAEAKSAVPNLTLTFGDGETHGSYEVQPVAEINGNTRQRLLAAWRKKYPHAVPDEDAFELGGQKISLGILKGLPGFSYPEDPVKYNAGVDRVFAKYEAFLQDWPAMVNAHRRLLALTLVLENAGTAPAHDIDVQLSTDAAGVWRDDLPKPPRVPALKKARNPWDIALRMPYPGHLPDIRGVALNANEDGPNISGKGAEQRVQYGIRRVMHHVPCKLPVVYFQFDSDDGVRSFTVNVQLVAANIRKPNTDALHVEVTKAAPTAPPLPPEPGDDSED